MSLPQAAIDRAKADIVEVVGRYVQLQKKGSEFVACCPFHQEKTPSFTVTEGKGYFCFGCGAKGGDAIDFVRAFESITFPKAVERIVGKVTGSFIEPVQRQPAKQQEEPEWTPVVPVPAGSASPNFVLRGELPTRSWLYRNADGGLIGYVCRFDLPGGGKDVRPMSWCVNTKTGETSWRWQSFAKPRPLYGMDKLAAHPKAQALLVEGEKAADAAQALYEAAGISRDRVVVISWPGGAKAVKFTDWSPLANRSVALWPDADQKVYPDNHPKAGQLMPLLEQPGTVAMLDIAASLKDRVTLLKIITPPAGVPDGWDLADAMPEGFDLLAHSKTAQPVEAFCAEHEVVTDLDAAVAAAQVPAMPSQVAAEFEPVDELPPAKMRNLAPRLVVQQDQMPAKQASRSLVDAAEDGSPIYDDKDPMPTARDMVWRLWWHSDSRTIQHHNNEFVTWADGHYVETGDHDVRAVVYQHLEGAQRWAKASKKDGPELVLAPFKPNRQKAADVLDAIRAVSNVPGTIPVPSWLDGGESKPPASEILPCANGLFHFASGNLLPHTPQFFGFNCLPFGYDKEAPDPAEWIQFLKTLWGEDQESIDTLQKMLGYLLTTDTSLQKIFLLVGPPRCGKGTILRVIEGLLGKTNICAPDLNTINERFALEGFVGKQAALVGDARISPKADQSAIAAKLLSISGEDAMGIDRKNRPYWFGKLNTRFVICSNLVPTLSDASGALASRFVILTMKQSFLGKEDHDLSNKLVAEMPGILKWAVEGWHKLQNAGRIETPKAAEEYAQELDDLASPIRRFIREQCEVEPGVTVDCKDMYETWRAWCKANGREHPGTEAAFGRDLRGSVHSISRKQYNNNERGRGYDYVGIKLNSAPFL